MTLVRFHKDLMVYQKTFSAALDIYYILNNFPFEKRYSLSNQKRKYSRSVCTNITEDWRKHKNEKSFFNKLNDADSKATETQNWIDSAL